MEKVNSSLRIAIFGGSQGVGKHCILLALNRGHIVTILVRDESKIKDISHQNLKVINGNVRNYEKVLETVNNQDVIVNSLGGWDDVCSKGTELIVRAMKEKNVRRIITCTSLGVGDSYPNCSLFTKLFIWMVIKKPIADKNIQEKILFDSGLDVIIVRPGGLTNNNPKGVFQSENVSGGRIPRADVADFMLQQLYSDQYLGKAVSIVSP